MRALALFSGGLDSLLAIRLIKEQGSDVTAIYFDIGFDSKSSKKEELQKRAESIGADFLIMDIKKQFFDDVLFTPRYGYGKYFNPCIDCHANMFKQAFSKMQELGGDFLISGEVVGQRPKSQRQEALKQVEKLSGAAGLIVRPLSAKLLDPTIPEQEGWIDRERLCGIHGRARHEQLALAERFKLVDLPTPAGGCLLTEDIVSQKIRDIRDFNGFTVGEIPLVKHGRYMILPDGARLVVGRDFNDNEGLRTTDTTHFTPLLQKDLIGPFSYLSNDPSPNDLLLAAKIVLTYSKGTGVNEKYTVTFGDKTVDTSPFESKETPREFLINTTKGESC